ncbi:transmembrane GTPase fzo1 [Auriscalpium vulgare]|uniref:Transmembrane GTPase fzo1 n=1 Tax=Auriscalpium vulgare TaxID=40419 RepID=A0ACB8RZI2_9AGAM|nr:transmembrane GTPase fzo1 [Auriscalpium vulgare]
MSQSYFAPRTQAERPEAPSASVSSDQQLRDVQEAYLEQKDRLVNALDSTKEILGDIKEFNHESWTVRYPRLREVEQQPTRRHGMRRSLSFADDPTTETDVVFSPAKGLTRSITLASVTDIPEEDDAAEQQSLADERLIPGSEDADFHVLRLDLKMGAQHAAASLVSQLEKTSIANLLDDRIASSMQHVDKLRVRVEDTSSKVLVTGDLNAGKSTFVNALLRREVMPIDQQPCTTAFCEVHDAAENSGMEEIHIIQEGAVYDMSDASTFTRAALSDLEDIVADNENTQQVIKLYLQDTRSPNESLLNNGIADISLIDAPGLNRDSIKTTAVFARQEEIDVVVFVVSAENHFTLSAKEFLLNASKEKAYVFIVVNKYEQIKNKDKCRRVVLEQIKQLSPRTYEDADDLVHFVDSVSGTQSQSFEDLEAALRSFVLVKRAKSKLNPASTYLSHLLSDINLLVGANAIVAQSELDRAREELSKARPVLEKMKNDHQTLDDVLEVTEEDGTRNASIRTKQRLSDALDRISHGLPAVDKFVAMPSYPGLLAVWDYARDVRKALLASLDMAVKLAEDDSRHIAVDGIRRISELEDQHLPEGVERSRRVFMPQAMFSPRASKDGRRRSRRSSGAVVAGGFHNLGIGLVHRSDLVQPTFFDLLDMPHYFGTDSSDSKESDDIAPTALGVVSVGLGALTMVGGQAVGARGLIEGIVRIADLLGNESARKWAAPVFGAFVVGATAYFVLELPSTIPRTVGRRIQRSLATPPDGQEVNEEATFVGGSAARISRETRKVLRLAAWDLKERFRTAMDERGREVKTAEDTERRATKALEKFKEVEGKTVDVRVHARLDQISA